jgi:Ca2+-transporting ATPase
MVIYIPFLQDIFKTTSLSGIELLNCLLVSSIVFWAIEFKKWLLRRRISSSEALKRFAQHR